MGRLFVSEEEEQTESNNNSINGDAKHEESHNNNNNSKADVAIRDRQPNQKPCLLFFQELTGSTTHALFDPKKKSLRTMEIRELGFPVQCLSSGHGWLLLLSRETSSLFFFNPFTRVRMELPYRKNCFDVAAFSASPTSRDCMVFAVETPYNHGRINIGVLCVGEPTWTARTYNIDKQGFSTAMQALYCNGVLYCIDSLGRIGGFDAGTGTWSVLYALKCPIVKNSYLVESEGQVLIGARGARGDLNELYKLKREDGEVKLEKSEELGDAKVFLGPYGSFTSSNEETEKKVFVAAYRSDRKCVVYKLDGCDCKKEINYAATRFGSQYTPVWIDGSH